MPNACIFPGQRAQYTGMGKELAERYRGSNEHFRPCQVRGSELI